MGRMRDHRESTLASTGPSILSAESLKRMAPAIGTYGLWATLAYPSLPLVRDLFEDNRYYAEIMHITGTLSVQLLALTLAITPFALLAKRWESGRIAGRFLLGRRRHLGVASFGYALLHLIFYIRETASLKSAYLEAFDLAFAFGWLGFLLLVPPFLSSNDFSVRTLGRKWKNLQRLTYPATATIFIHWFYFDFFWDEVLTWLFILGTFKLAHIAYRRAAKGNARKG